MVLMKYKESPFVQSFYSNFLRGNEKLGTVTFSSFYPSFFIEVLRKKGNKKEKGQNKR